MIFSLKSLPAYDGDCFIISFGEDDDIKNIVVDGGRRKKVVKKLKKEFQRIKKSNQFVDLMILTHIDEDHIQGLIKIFEDREIDEKIIKKVWFNSKELLSKYFIGVEQEDDKLFVQDAEGEENISFKQGISLGKFLEKARLSSSHLIYSGQELKIGEATLKVLSPNIEGLEKLFKEWDKVFPAENSSGIPISSRSKEDYNKTINELLYQKFVEDKAEANGSSIAFSIELQDKKLLMLGDSHPSVVGENLKKMYYSELKKIPFNAIKISHHGSKHNTSDQLLALVSCNHYLISTNGLTHGLPNKETIVKIAMSSKQNDKKTKIYFNYPNVFGKILNEKEMAFLNVECIDEESITNEILEVDLWNYLEN